MATVPTLASPKDEKMTICEITTAAAPIAHHHLGAKKMAAAATKHTTAAANQSRPAKCEIGCASCGTSATSKALTKPKR